MNSIRINTGYLVRIGVAAAVAFVLLSLVITAIRRPVEGPTATATADFTDVSGLHVDSDVRMRGLQIGKVRDITIVRDSGHSLARVTLALATPHRLTSDTRLAVKYQNLTGIRYVDLAETDGAGRPVTHLGTDHTQPSFDITRLFNGLQPVLRTLSPEEINTFTQNALTVLQGDGSGLAPMLDSMQKLADQAHDREQLISTLVDNMSRIDSSLGGKSANVIQFIRNLSITVTAANTVLDEFRKTDLYGPQFMRPVARLITEIGLQPDTDVDQLLHTAFSSTSQAAEALRLLPNAFEGLRLPGLTTSGADATACSHGSADLPDSVKVLFAGSEVTVCKPN
ncbi:MlaD family protein [Nocardia africana]|uniref:Virulence factor Mce family protein n=1 Tax=Nocardia africana TaxID=134964 RepID=A0A378WZ04_9NOCA|nr:MlaD family protein [Nocardia africana]MCC3312273.1 MCE family protein [Nocardia africana]SUA46419.1 virulence factor Mce family protein [Nocardia africana]